MNKKSKKKKKKGKKFDLIDELEEWRFEQPLTEEEKAKIPPGMTERVWRKVKAKIDEAGDQGES